MKTKNLVFSALGAVLIVICSWISIPTVVPFTLQTFAIFFVLSLLGAKQGTISIVVYILLGAIGLPVFAGFNSGLGALFGPTGGYVIGFIFIGIVYWIFTTLLGEKTWVKALALGIGLLICYALGTAWFMMVYPSGAGLLSALGMCVLPFIIPDVIKLVVAILASKYITKNNRIAA